MAKMKMENLAWKGQLRPSLMSALRLIPTSRISTFGAKLTPHSPGCPATGAKSMDSVRVPST